MSCDRDPLDRYYTPDALALAMCEWARGLGVAPRAVMEPCVGGGAFVRAARAVWPAALVYGRDIDPDASGLSMCDAVPGTVRVDLAVTNPPFSTGSTAERERAFAVCEAAIRSAPACVLLLPASWLLGGAAYSWLRSDGLRPAYVSPIIGRPWSGTREMAAYAWVGDLVRTAIMEPIEWERERERTISTVVAPKQEALF